MRIAFPLKLLFVLTIGLLFFAPSIVKADIAVNEAAKMLPDGIGDFRAQGAVRPSRNLFEAVMPEDFGALSAAARAYSNARGETYLVALTKTRSDSGAYALLTSAAAEERKSVSTRALKTGEVGTAAYAAPKSLGFFKGATFVRIENAGSQSSTPETMERLARLFADALDKGEDEIPVLVKHLPDWEAVHGNVKYATSLHALQEFAGHRPALYAVNFDGGTEAVSADYGTTQMVLVEYTTPQIATTSDASITERIGQLRARGEPVPSAYRRVGNYSVFVFNSPDEITAAQLIDKVSYEQVVQWLGHNPRALERAQRAYAQTTANVILAVLKASGLSLLICLCIGGIFGTIVFRHRRAQQSAAQAYSDAGGIMRLNIDEMTPPQSNARLIGKGER